jgi:hypothetical protein
MVLVVNKAQLPRFGVLGYETRELCVAPLLRGYYWESKCGLERVNVGTGHWARNELDLQWFL